MKEILKLIGGVIHSKNPTGQVTGLLSLIKEKTGKISFKRSFGIVVATYVFTVHVPANGGKLDWLAIAALAIAVVPVALPKLFSKDSE